MSTQFNFQTNHTNWIYIYTSTDVERQTMQMASFSKSHFFFFSISPMVKNRRFIRIPYSIRFCAISSRCIACNLPQYETIRKFVAIYLDRERIIKHLASVKMPIGYFFFAVHKSMKFESQKFPFQRSYISIWFIFVQQLGLLKNRFDPFFLFRQQICAYNLSEWMSTIHSSKRLD